jgi:hypothetical protein
MKTNSDNCIGSLAYSFADDVVVNVFYVAAIRAKLILVWIVSICLLPLLILLYLVRQLCIISLLLSIASSLNLSLRS